MAELNCLMLGTGFPTWPDMAQGGSLVRSEFVELRD